MIPEEEMKRRMGKALAKGGPTHTVEDVVAELRQGTMQWWSNGDGCVVTEILNFPRLKALHLFLGFGAIKSCYALDPEFSAWAQEQGCSRVIVHGRTGMAGGLAKLGYRPNSVLYIKQLGGA